MGPLFFFSPCSATTMAAPTSASSALPFLFCFRQRRSFARQTDDRSPRRFSFIFVLAPLKIPPTTLGGIIGEFHWFVRHNEIFNMCKIRLRRTKKSCKPSCQPKKEKISAPRHDATMCKFSPLGWVLKGACDAPLPLAFSVDIVSTLQLRLNLRRSCV